MIAAPSRVKIKKGSGNLNLKAPLPFDMQNYTAPDSDNVNNDIVHYNAAAFVN